MVTSRLFLAFGVLLSMIPACVADHRSIGYGELKRRRANDPVLHNEGPYIETWTVATAAGREIRFLSSDAPTSCGDVKGWDSGNALNIAVSAAGLYVGDVPVVPGPVDRAVPGAAIEAGFGITQGTLTLTQIGDPMVGTFAGTGPGGEVVASFHAPSCD